MKPKSARRLRVVSAKSSDDLQERVLADPQFQEFMRVFRRLSRPNQAELVAMMQRLAREGRAGRRAAIRAVQKKPTDS